MYHQLTEVKNKQTNMDNSDIVAFHGVSNQGGIRKSNRTRSFVLITNHNVEKYHDYVPENFFEIKYEGAFTHGKRDQEMTRMNKALSETDWDLHVYSRIENSKKLIYEYVGVYKRVGEPVFNIRASDNKRVYTFTLRRITQDIKYDFDSFEY